MTPAARNVDIKLKYDPTDMVPGAAGRIWVRDTLLTAGSADTQGYSLADCLLRRRDMGAVTAAGAPVPGVPVAAGNVQQAARRTRLKDSFAHVMQHVAEENTRTIYGDPTHPAFGNGPLAFEEISAKIVISLSTTELQQLNIEWHTTEIVTEVGVSENTVQDVLDYKSRCV